MDTIYVNTKHVAFVEETEQAVVLVMTTGDEIPVVEDIGEVMTALDDLDGSFVALTRFNDTLAEPREGPYLGD